MCCARAGTSAGFVTDGRSLLEWALSRAIDLVDVTAHRLQIRLQMLFAERSSLLSPARSPSVAYRCSLPKAEALKSANRLHCRSSGGAAGPGEDHSCQRQHPAVDGVQLPRLLQDGSRQAAGHRARRGGHPGVQRAVHGLRVGHGAVELRGWHSGIVGCTFLTFWQLIQRPQAIPLSQIRVSR